MTNIKASCLLVINVGSSSIKFQLFSRQPNPKILAYGKVVDIGCKPSFTVTDDLKILEESENEKARFALKYFCLKMAQFMGMMAMALGEVDAIVFTGGTGENSAFVRDGILRQLEFLKLVLLLPMKNG
ncbi:Propionate kinase [Legionella pneumophila]|uniref:acetate kinase n=1 Tax=Legionella TaxID=445 RepID=UPI0001E3C80A|nr:MULTISPECIES: acetate kinase [Legionella]AGH53191.1 Acetate kinase [Legionella pneumophila subsp. pneumophila LPE509]AOU25854.1 hypothetical protein A9E77_10220 [Legionella pneumophila]MCW8421962.1 hypothetical protein [Legionella sp. PATHC032]MCW8433402.1 hypothetical protein [Legionella pneumophila]MCW8458031.1 hypothetical protein [Legionella pneumophila]